MTTPASQDAWGLDRIRQIVAQNDLERGQIEPRGQPSQITGPARTAALTTLKSNETPLTGPGSSLAALMSQMISSAFGANDWQLDGQANTRQFSARW